MFDRKYTDEIRARSVERVLQRRQEEPGNRAILREVAEEFEVGPQSLRKWVARYDDGSYDYDLDDESPLPKATGRKTGQRELQARIQELEHAVTVLQEDNRSLTRVVALLSEELRLATAPGVQSVEARLSASRSS